MDLPAAKGIGLSATNMSAPQTPANLRSFQFTTTTLPGSRGNEAPGQEQSKIPKPPSLSLPKGGGAIHGMGEKFDVAQSTGAGSASIPIRVSPGRDDLHPELRLEYSSGAGNGPFGLGWHLDIPHITRKTEKGLPRYMDSGPESNADVFLIAGAEDLVPVFLKDAQGNVVLNQDGTPMIKDTPSGDYLVRKYQPRIEGLFSRIERWMNTTDPGDIYWRVITGANVTSVYGRNDNSRVFNSASSQGNAKCIFSWLICERFDDRGNAMVFTYKAEDSSNVNAAQAHEANRMLSSRTTHRYLKTIQYGNQSPNRDLTSWVPTSALGMPDSAWHFSVIFDYGEHSDQLPTPIEEQPWACRQDPFSTYKPGFEDRVYRLCKRILMFHHFSELGNSPSLVSSMDFEYNENPYAAKLLSCTATGYSPPPQPGSPYIRKTLPPLQYEYTEFPADEDLAKLTVQDIDQSYLENVPAGIDGSIYQWLDLYSEGLPGIFCEQADRWFYKRNSSTNNIGTTRSASDSGSDEAGVITPRLEPLSLISSKPSLSIMSSHAHFGDVDGSGYVDVIDVRPGGWGYFEQSDEQGWTDFFCFPSNPNVPSGDTKLVDLTGDGLADLLVASDQTYIWCQSLGVQGFGAPQAIAQASEESKGPVSLFSDTEGHIVLADISGDGLSDVVRIRNGDICYWPNLGYGRFGAMIQMDNAPWFDPVDLFQTKRVHLADIDGSGTTDLLYVHAGGVDIYLNCAGNGFSDRKRIESFPANHTLSQVSTVDLLGTGTACLVWSSQAPQSVPTLQYLDITGGVKPHLLVKSRNNLGAETEIQYAPSTKFYLQDVEDGRPWLTRIPFPVHCVERVDIYDRISGNRLTNRYRYHDGFYDGLEREFRGFAMVERWDTDDFTESSKAGSTNADSSWHIPPVHTKTWYHTGVYIDNAKITSQWAHQYFGSTSESTSNLLDDTILPSTLSLGGDELRESCRALKGHVLRSEVYADDETSKSGLPYYFTESNYRIEVIQSRQDANLHSIYLVCPREQIEYSCEREPEDPRIQHELTLQVDAFGNPLKTLKVAYGRRPGKGHLSGTDRAKQESTLFMYTENTMTTSIDLDNDYRLPTRCETKTYELSGLIRTPGTQLRISDFDSPDFTKITNLPEIPFEQRNNPSSKQKRLIKQSRCLFRKDDLSGLLDFREIGTNALVGCEYELCFTPGLLATTYQRKLSSQQFENLIPDPSGILGGTGSQQAGYVDLNGDGSWWKPSGRAYYHPDFNATALQELVTARQHFFSVRRITDPFGNSTQVTLDTYDLFPTQTMDPMGNTTKAEMDYRVLTPALVTDPNGNQSAAAFDALGLVVGTAVMGKQNEGLGDSLSGFQTDLAQDQIDHFFANPRSDGSITTSLLGSASSRIIYDPNRYFRAQSTYLPTYAATISRETHVSDLSPGTTSKVQLGFAYSDGFGRVIQSKKQDKAGPLTERGSIVQNRWAASGWTIYNNKALPVRTYEPFFDNTHDFKFFINGVSTISFYDPLGRAVATLHPNKTLNKVRFDSWTQTSFDGNDNVLVSAPKTDPDVGPYIRLLPDFECTPSWYDERIGIASRPEERSAALKTALHANTPMTAHLDVLGRPFMSVRDNGPEGKLTSRSNIDIQGNQYELFDAVGRLAMRYDMDMTGTRIHQASIDSGERWLLLDVTGNPMLVWNSRGFRQRSVYDSNRRLTESYNRDDSHARSSEILVARFIFGESQSDVNPAGRNLRGKTYAIHDQGGTVTLPNHDFKGNALRSERQFAQDYKTSLDWTSAVGLESETFISTTSYDAMNRTVATTTPDKSISYRGYNESGRLDRVQVNIRGEQASADPATWTSIVASSDYNARGQITFQSHGNGAVTNRTYDEKTFRLHRIHTVLASNILQDLNYVYDPEGNITSVRDNAQQTIYFRNAVVNPINEYTYDPIYRLISATGREHLGQTSQPRIPSALDQLNIGLLHPGDGSAMAEYTESYTYDAVDNMTKVAHAGGDTSRPGWTQNLAYDSTNNRLLRSSVRSGFETYAYDANGNMTKLSSLSALSWNFLDQLQSSTKQIVNRGTPETTYYVYDITGQRIRKVTERAAAATETPVKLKERLYMGMSELYRTYAGDGTTKTLERETLRADSEVGTAVRVETRTLGDDQSVSQQLRYQFSNNIGSAMLELGTDGGVISYEEFTPYGSTSYQALASQVDAPKRYRYSGKERDEESGLVYFGARYLATWIGRWISCDPIGIKDSINLYEFTRSSPVSKADPNGTECDPTNATCNIRNHSAPEELSSHAPPVMAEKVPVPSHATRITENNTTAPQPSNWVRLGGAFKMLGGGFEVVGGGAAILAPEPTLLTKPVGALLLGHGLDTFQAGIRQLISGTNVTSGTQALLTDAAGLVTEDKTKQELFGAGADMALSMTLSFGAGALARAAPAAESTLVHLTTKEGYQAMTAENVLGRAANPKSLYAAAVAEGKPIPTPGVSVPGWDAVKLGLLPSVNVPLVLPQAANVSFRMVTPVGVLTGIQRYTNVAYSSPGTLNLATGAFTGAGSSLNQAAIYGVDAFVTSAISHVAPPVAEHIGR